jgi:hypothetical protein
MAQIPPYTSTYTDVDSSIMDADDLVAEFWRVSEFIALWSGSIEAIGQEDHFEEFIEIVTGELAEIIPANGLIQRFEVDASVESFDFTVLPHTIGAPFRVYVSLRCGSPNTTFRVSVPRGETHIFGVNRDLYQFTQASEPYQPSAVVGDGYFGATILVTYGSENGTMVQVFAHNPETALVNFNDVLTASPI